MRSSLLLWPFMIVGVGCSASSGADSPFSTNTLPGGAGGAVQPPPTGTVPPPPAAGGGAGAPVSASGGSTATGGATAVPPPVIQVDGGGYPYDRGVGFEWPETAPSAGPCLAGTYTGQFTCQLNPGGIFPPGTVTGPVSFTLEQSSSGEFLVIKNGTLNGVAQTFAINFTSPIAGQLDCATNQFHADATNGTYGTPPFTGTFGGTLDAELNRTTQTLAGTWTLEATGSNLPCVGPWTAVKQP